jgi:hypothetical protein
MNSKDLEQVRILRRYLLDRAGRTRSPLVRNQIRRWVEQCDAARFGRRGVNESASSEEIAFFLKAA